MIRICNLSISSCSGDSLRQISLHIGDDNMYAGDILSKRAVDAVFQGLFLFTDIRGILRESAPDHQLTDDEQERTQRILEKLEKQIAIVREELVG